MKKSALFKNLLLFTTIAALSPLFWSCKKQNNQITNKKTVLCTIFPAYDWVKNIIGPENPDITVELLIKNGADIHSYQPTAKDMIMLSTADMVIYVGGESDFWIKEALKSSMNKNQIQLCLMDVLKDKLKLEEGTENETGNPENDEHVWLSLKNADISCRAITEKICILDKQYTGFYGSELRKYLGTINLVESKYLSPMLKHTPIIVCDRFPFRYLTDEFLIPYYAAFSGCSAETEASFETVAFLTAKAKELNCKAIYVCEGNDRKLAETVIKNAELSDCKIVTLNSMQAVTLKETEQDIFYLQVMEDNLKKLFSADTGNL